MQFFLKAGQEKTANTSSSFFSFSCDQSIGEIVVKGCEALQTACQGEENSKTVKPQE